MELQGSIDCRAEISGDFSVAKHPATGAIFRVSPSTSSGNTGIAYSNLVGDDLFYINTIN
jgi:hypothetical protein